ncbi:hypothetical protein [Candidatus Orientia mediorientalis]|nr:hypothetical protein [Candidatus Orientia mediorientalis]
MQHIVLDITINSCNFTKNNSVNNDTIFYHLIFISTCFFVILKFLHNIKH